MKKTTSIFFIPIFIIALCSCQNNDAIFLKELKQQNAFLEEQYEQSCKELENEQQSNYISRAYNTMFKKQALKMDFFYKSINALDNKNLTDNFNLFKKQSDNYFDSIQKKQEAGFWEEGSLLLKFKNDSITEHYSNNLNLKKELIKQHILQHYINISDLCRYTSNYGCWSSIARNGRQIIIKKNEFEFIIDVKCYTKNIDYDYYKKLEYLSFSKKIKSNNIDEFNSAEAEIKEKTTNSEGLLIKTSLLKNGYYRICFNRILIYPDGIIYKEEDFVDFEIN